MTDKIENLTDDDFKKIMESIVMTTNTKMHEAFEKWYLVWKAWQAAQSEQSAELERLRKDAERYRWLRDDAFKHSEDCFFEAGRLFAGHQGDSFDVAIDAAMQERQP